MKPWVDAVHRNVKNCRGELFYTGSKPPDPNGLQLKSKTMKYADVSLLIFFETGQHHGLTRYVYIGKGLDITDAETTTISNFLKAMGAHVLGK